MRLSVLSPAKLVPVDLAADLANSYRYHSQKHQTQALEPCHGMTVYAGQSSLPQRGVLLHSLVAGIAFIS